MGCNQSTQQDTQQSRQREPAQATAPQAARQPTTAPTMPASTPSLNAPVRSGRGDNDDGAPFSMSYSDRRMQEQDFYKDLIARTANKFIDVAQTQSTPTLETSEAVDRASKYRVDVSSSANPTSLEALLVLPIPSKGAKDVAAVLSAPSALSAADRELLRASCESVVGALRGLKVTPVGDLVVAFPEF